MEDVTMIEGPVTYVLRTGLPVQYFAGSDGDIMLDESKKRAVTFASFAEAQAMVRRLRELSGVMWVVEQA